MASLRDAVKDYQDELRAGIAWVAFWREGRSWNSDYIYLETDDTLTPEDRGRLQEIQAKDPAAVVLNGYYCGYLGAVSYTHLDVYKRQVPTWNLITALSALTSSSLGSSSKSWGCSLCRIKCGTASP